MTNSQENTNTDYSISEQNQVENVLDKEVSSPPYSEQEKPSINSQGATIMEEVKPIQKQFEELKINPQEKKSQDNIDSVKPLIDNVNSGIEQLQKGFEQLQKDFETKIKYDQSKERTIDTLHKELQDHREDISFKTLRPLIMDIASIYDDLKLLVMKYNDSSKPEQKDSISSDLTTFVEEIEEMVSHYGFEFYQNDSETYERSKQKAQKIINTDDSNLDKQIVERRRMGLQYQQRIVRPEVVTVYRYVSNK